MTDDYYMQQALKQAELAYEADEVPIGAIIVMQNRIIAKAFNQVEKLNDSTAHAEILALTSAFSFLGSKYLPEATLYVTIEPCLMCAGALYWSKIGKVVYGANDVKHGSLSHNLVNVRHPFHPKTMLVSSVCKEDCAFLIKQFFKAKR